jgi:prolyl oligopeptidase
MLLVVAVACSAPPPAATKAPPASSLVGVARQKALVYPATRRVEQVDDYAGVRVADPYRWLEDIDSSETKAWIGSQNALAADYIGAIPERAKIRERLPKLAWESFSPPEKVSGTYFYSRFPDAADEIELHVTKSLREPGRILLDAATLSNDGTVAVAGHSISDDARWLAYGIARAGSDWEEWHVRSVETRRDLDDRLDWIKGGSPVWTKDEKGFYYSRYDEPKNRQERTEYNKLYYHRLGAKQADDELVYKRDDHKDWGFGADVTEDGHYLVITVWKGTDPNTAILYQDLEKKGPIVELLMGFDHAWNELGNVGSRIYFKTDLEAERGRIVTVDVANPAQPVEVVPQSADAIDGVSMVGSSLVVTYCHDAHSLVRVFDLDGKPRADVALPGPGKVEGFGGYLADRETFFSFKSFTHPSTIYRYDFDSGPSEVWKKPAIDFDADSYETRQVFVASKDGTKVPLWITGRKGASEPGPTLLTGYGGFDISLTPEFSVEGAAFLETGGTYAVANLRGGGEYGEAWHRAGTRGRKQNVIDDFIACAEWLEKNGVAAPGKLAIDGASNGGLLVGACLVQRPGLFAAALADVGVMDMLRFDKFTGGWEWLDEYGSPEDPEAFPALRAISPYHNVKPGVRYPPTLITTADHDDRVVPGHSFKFAAALQAAQAGTAPILLRVDENAGHDRNSSIKETEKMVDRLAFLADALR